MVVLFEGFTFFAESLKIMHSVPYEGVPYSLREWPDMLVVYDILDREVEPPYSPGQMKNNWLDRQDKELVCQEVGAPLVPLVWKGRVEPYNLPRLADKISAFSGTSKIEGIVLKNYKTGVFGKFINLEFQRAISDEALWGGVHPSQRGIKNTRKRFV